MTDQEISELVAYCRVIWPSQPDVDQKLAVIVWRNLLGDLDARFAHAAVDEIAARGERFAPPVGLIRRTALMAVDQIPTADQALAEIWRSVNADGGEFSREWPEWSHPMLDEIIDSLGGWQVVCDVMDANQIHANLWRACSAVSERYTNERLRPPSMRALEPPSLPALGTAAG